MRSLFLASLLLLPPTLHATEVTLKAHPEMNAWSYYDKPLPKPSWNKDGSLSAWGLGHSTGSASIQETGARADRNKQALTLCYATRPREHAPGAPVPAIALPVVLEFRVRGLPAGDYVVQEVGVCK